MLGQAEVAEKAAAHPAERAVLLVIEKIAKWFADTGEDSMVIPLRRRVVSSVEEHLGMGSAEWPTAMVSLADALVTVKQWPEAEDCFKRAIGAQSTLFGPDHTSTALTMNSLAALYNGQGRFAEGKVLTDRANDIFTADLLSHVVIKDLDSGTTSSLAKPTAVAEKAVNPIELHQVGEILETCVVKNLDTGTCGSGSLNPCTLQHLFSPPL